MRWQKLGLVYKPDGSMRWARSHAMIPTPLFVEHGVIRIYVTCLDDRGVGRVGVVDVQPRIRVRCLMFVENTFWISVGAVPSMTTGLYLPV